MPKFLYFPAMLLCVICSSCSVFHIKTPKPEQPHRAPLTKPVKNTERVVVFSHGWHTGIVIPTSALRRHPWTKDLNMKQIPHAEFGWGAEEFYRKPHITVGMVVRGLFWPTAAVIHLERFPESPYKHYPTSQLVTLEFTPAETDSLIDELRKSFSAKPDGSLVNLGHGIEKDSTFFRSRFKYYYPETCNVWTSRLLRAAGINLPLSTRSPDLMKELRKSSKVVN